MGNKIKGKKILFLGSTSNIAGMVRNARQMGLHTIVTDYIPYERAPAKKVADEYENISLADIDAIVELINSRSIDGVLTGFSDSYLQYYYEICEKSGLPCYGNSTSFGIATDKKLFKKACQDYDVGTIPGKSVNNYNDLLEIAKELGFPLMLKPVDNSGSRGIIKCENNDELKYAFDYAISFSLAKTILCEKYMNMEGIGVSYQLINSESYLSSTCDRYNYISKKNGSAITEGLLYPSKYTDRYISEVDVKIQKMLKNNGFNNGMVSLQAFVDENGFYMCEMCFRPSGGHHYILIKNQNGIDELELLIEYAVTGTIIDYDISKETPYFKDLCSLIKIIGKPDEEINLCEGYDLIENLPGVIDVIRHHDTGDRIGKDGTTAQVLGDVWCKVKDMQLLEQLVQDIKKSLKIKNSKGESLILRIPSFKHFYDNNSKSNK